MGSLAYLLKINQGRQFIKFLILITSRTHVRSLSKSVFLTNHYCRKNLQQFVLVMAK